MKLMIPVISLCLASAAPCALSQATAQPNLSTIDQYVETALQKSHGAGISVAVVQDGKVILAKGYGLANVELSVPATENTVYQIASVTKTFTATAINMLVDEDKLKLDDKIVSHLPDLPAAWKEVTIRQLLSHTSGIKSYTSVKDFFKTAQRLRPAQILDLVAKAPLEFTPGEKWNYSNTGYFLLGLLIEKVTGKTFGDFMAEPHFQAARNDADPRERPPFHHPQSGAGLHLERQRVEEWRVCKPEPAVRRGHARLDCQRPGEVGRRDGFRETAQEIDPEPHVDPRDTRQGRACEIRTRLGARRVERPPPAISRRWHPRLQLATHPVR